MRKRKKLEVSTFPFLAVLLCTMGSLILLLLVIDKKAKKAALEKAYEAAWNKSRENQIKTEHENSLIENMKNDWIKNKTNNHEQLAKQELLLEKEIAELKKQFQDQEKKKALSKNNEIPDDIKKKALVLENSKNKLLALENKLEETKTNADKTEKESKTLSEQIISMELILKELKASKEKEKYSFSIVPYFGKSGLNRRPLYIECNEAGIMFFPDKTLVPTSDETNQLKELVQNRIVQLREYLEQSLGPKNSTPYMMILVRPDGISNYWKLQSVIKSMDVDYGYELVDKSWNLDIPLELSSPSPKNLASMIIPNGAVKQFPRPIPAPGNIRGGINNGNGFIPQTNDPSEGSGTTSLDILEKNNGTGNSKDIGYGATAKNIRPLISLPGFPQNNSSGNSQGKNNNNPKTNNYGQSSTSNDIASNKTSSNISNNSIESNNTKIGNNSKDNSARNNSSNQKNQNNSSKNEPSQTNLKENYSQNFEENSPDKITKNYSSSDNKNNNKADNDNNLPSQTIDPDFIKNNTGANSSGTSGGTKGNNNSSSGNGFPESKNPYSVQATPNSFPNGNSTGKKNDNSSSNGTDKIDANQTATAGKPSNQTSTSNPPNNSNPSQTPSLGNESSSPSQPNNPNLSITFNNKEKTDLQETTKQPPPLTTYNKEDDFAKETESQDPTARVAAPLPELGPRKTKAPAPLRPARLFAERDWVIYVECKFEEILVHPNRLVIPTNLLASDEGIKRFVLEIEKMIQRKQSTVRQGEPPYRPEVRFLVWPDGLRPYHLCYPALQIEGMKQKRQNLEREDSVREILQGR